MPLDDTDVRLLDFMLTGLSPRECAKKMNKPVSTIQRRARHLIRERILKSYYEIGYEKLGIKRGLLHVYLKDGNISGTVDTLRNRAGITRVGIHLGNSDIVGSFIYKESRDVLDLISWAKELDGVDRIVWSEEVYSYSVSPKLESVIGNGKSLNFGPVSKEILRSPIEVK